MVRVKIIAVGRMRDRDFLSLWQDYTKRLQWPLDLHEVEAKSPAETEKKIIGNLAGSGYTIVLDERGRNIDSITLASRIRDLGAQGRVPLSFVIGGANGVGDAVRGHADFLLSFGAQTWPHMLVRVMLAEQIYRCQQILAGHPYHRE